MHTTDLLTLRATAIALWTPLRHALQHGWPILTDWTNHDPRGNPHTSDYSPAGVPGPLPTYTPTNTNGRILGRLEPNQWPGGGHILTTRLWQDTYEQQAATLTRREAEEWEQAWENSNATHPFLRDTNRHGNPTLRRNHDPQALITPHVATFLTTLATLTEIQLLTPEQDARIYAALLDDDTPDPIRPSETFAIAQKSGIKPD